MTPLVTTDVHESGHCLIAHRLGFRIERVSIMRGGTSRGTTTVTIPARASMVARLAFLQAGDAAVALIGVGLRPPARPAGSWYFDAALTGQHDDVQGSQSDDDARAALRPTVEQITHAERFCQVELRRHWRALTVLGDELLEHGALDGATVHAIFDRYGVPRSVTSSKPRKPGRRQAKSAGTTGPTFAERMRALGVEVEPLRVGGSVQC